MRREDGMRKALVAPLLALAFGGSLAPSSATAVQLATTQVGYVCQALGVADDYFYGDPLPIAQNTSCNLSGSGNTAWGPYIAHAEGNTSSEFGAIPQIGIATASTSASSDNGTASSYIYSNIQLYFQTQLINSQIDPGLNFIPVLISAEGAGHSDRTGFGLAESKGTVQVSGSNLNFQPLLFEFDAYVVDEIAFDPVDSENQTDSFDGSESVSLITGDVYTVTIFSSCESWVAPIGGQSAGATAGCTSWVDPFFAFDQAAFDQQMGGDTYRLDEYYQFVFSPNVPVPETETYALMLAGLGLVGFAARRRYRF